MNLLLGGISVILFLWLVSRGSVYVHINYFKDEQQDLLELQVYLFNYFRLYQHRQDQFIHTVIKVQQAKLFAQKAQTKKQEQPQKSFLSKLAHINYPQLLILHFACRKLYGKIRIATEDAGETAVIFGALQMIKVGLLRHLCKKIEFKSQPIILLIPDFQGAKQEILLQCIVSAKIGYIIGMLKKLI